jgi:plasmid stability protein
MPEIVLSDVSDVLILALDKRAANHHRSPTDEAKTILSEALLRPADGNWSKVDEIYNRLAGSGRKFDDSTDLIREDRDR